MAETFSPNLYKHTTTEVTEPNKHITEIYDEVQNKLSETQIESKTAADLLSECTNCISNHKQTDIYNNCAAIKRIIIVLTAYKKIQKLGLRENISFVKIFTFKDIYTLTEINNDFFHIKDHIDAQNTNSNEMALHRQFRQQFGRKALDKYAGFRRFRRREKYSYSKPMTDQDDDFRQTFDKIYSYLIHVNHSDSNGSKNTKPYIGQTEDEKWFNYPTDAEHGSDEDIYQYLVENMGHFRWQSCHGFNSKQHRGLMHLRPKYENIKQEVLQNAYFSVSTDNWNQTLRKSKVFEQSFARLRIKTSYAGKYDDKISQECAEWDKGEVISLQEIMIFKLYTDSDKLQYELKKCFRFDGNMKQNWFLLEQRLRTFYWWRIKLLAVLNKYAQLIDANVPLYHGVNSKMVINREQRQAFHGPLSASLSYHVARTFATAKGMVLELTTQFPQLCLCRAFDASLISDYPEEKERIISFAYLRIKTVFTRTFNKKWKSFADVDGGQNGENVSLSCASKMRSVFFAIHLFRQQIFSMAVHLEYWLSAFLYLYCDYDELCENNDNGQIKQTEFVRVLEELESYKCDINRNGLEVERCNKILTLLRDKFDDFRKRPNAKQIVKIDQISENLKAFFLDYAGLDIYNDKKYVISFEKIVKIFENVRQIHLVNAYKFDDLALDNLVQYLFKNPTNKLKVIKFLYYDCELTSLQNNKVAKLKEISLKRLNAMKWDIKVKKNGKTGYEIKLFCIETDKKMRRHSKKKPKHEINGYEAQLSSFKISQLLTNRIATGIRERIPREANDASSYIHSYMIKASSLHDDKYNTFSTEKHGHFEIYDYDLHDITTGEKLYFVAKNVLKPKKERGFTKKLLDQIFNANDIKNEFDILKCQLPTLWKIRPCFAKQLHRKQCMVNILKNKCYMERLIEKIRWHKEDKVPIYNKHENKNRITYSIEKEDFIAELIEFMKSDKNISLVPVLIRNQSVGHHVEFMQMVTIKIKQYQCTCDIALSYEYETKNSIKIVGIYLDKCFILSQHQLICECRKCECLQNFKSNIDHLTIGNPDHYKNNMNKSNKRCQELRRENKEIKKRLKLKPAKLSMNNVHSISAQVRVDVDINEDIEVPPSSAVCEDLHSMQMQLQLAQDADEVEKEKTVKSGTKLNAHATPFKPTSVRVSTLDPIEEGVCMDLHITMSITDPTKQS